MALTVGTQLGSHEIIALLRKGGMGEVYRARDIAEPPAQALTRGQSNRKRK